MVVIKSRRLPSDQCSLYVCNCAERPEHSHSEISFLHICNIQNLISHTHHIALSKRLTGLASTVYMVVKLHA